eukprot:4486163-Amphidinium_carterae.1
MRGICFFNLLGHKVGSDTRVNADAHSRQQPDELHPEQDKRLCDEHKRNPPLRMAPLNRELGAERKLLTNLALLHAPTEKLVSWKLEPCTNSETEASLQ